MLGRLYENQECSATRTLELVGERWSLLILRDAMFRNFTRFSQFQRSLGIATNVLARRLEGFLQAGLMEHRQPGASGEQHPHSRARGERVAGGDSHGRTNYCGLGTISLIERPATISTVANSIAILSTAIRTFHCQCACLPQRKEMRR